MGRDVRQYDIRGTKSSWREWKMKLKAYDPAMQTDTPSDNEKE